MAILEQFFPATGVSLSALQYKDCLKFADYVVVNSLQTTGASPVSIISFEDARGMTLFPCAFMFVGKLFGLDMGQTGKFKVFPAGGQPGKGSEQTEDALTEFQFGRFDDRGRFVPIYEVTDLRPFSAREFLDILRTIPVGDSVDDFVRKFFGGDDVFRSRGGDDRIEVGAGDDRVISGGGDDVVFKAARGDLDYRGGGGVDMIEFASDGGSAIPAPIRGATVDFAKGTGKNPFGGALKFKSVEAVRDTAEADKVFGSGKDERVLSDRPGGDVFKLKGGDDFISLFGAAPDMVIDGGKGRDELVLALPERDVRLDLKDGAMNAGALEGSTIKGIEVIRATLTAAGATFQFKGTGADEEVYFTGFGFGGDHPRGRINMGSGDDIAQGGFGADLLLGGKGNDWLSGRDNDDKIRGGNGRDRIDGGAGDDDMAGGRGPDFFIFAPGFGQDLIADFNPGQDHLDFSGHAGVERLRDLKLSQVGEDLHLIADDGARVILEDVARAEIDAGDFLF